MPPPPGCPLRTEANDDNITNSSTTSNYIANKPPLPTAIARGGFNRRSGVEVLVPPLVSGALVAAFARAVAEGLGNELLTHYYFTTPATGGTSSTVNVDRVLDRLLAEFTRALWDELFDFYTGNGRGYTRQVARLFDGPIRQIAVVLNGPETATCLLDHIGPGLSRRKLTWSKDATGIELGLALQLICGYWHREYPDHSPGGSPEEISRVLCGRLVTGQAARGLVNNIKKVLLSPHYVQLHILETTVWDRILKRRRPPPTDGFHVAQFRFECQLAIKPGEYASPEDIDLSARQAITGTSTECQLSTVLEYVDKRWQRCGRLVLAGLNNAVKAAYCASEEGEGFSGMFIWDGSNDDGQGDFCPGLRLLHFEVENGLIQLTACAWALSLVEIFQQMAWMCAALGSAPTLEDGRATESAVEISEGCYEGDTMFFNCSMAHQLVANEGSGVPWLREIPGAVIARGFPIDMGR
ncbi:hypothetical protein CC79DRAFT_1367943 [Sarocladium strictum]